MSGPRPFVPAGYTFPAKPVLLVLLSITCLLTAASLTVFYYPGHIYTEEFVPHLLSGLKRLFDLDSAANIPSWYASSLILTASALLAYIAYLKTPTQDAFLRYWQGLALIFLLLSADESAFFHDLLNNPLRAALGGEGFLLYPWVAAAALVSLLVVALYLRFLGHLPAKTRWLFVTAAVLFLGGSILIESWSSHLEALHGVESFRYEAAMTLEEFGEMSGINIFIYALLDYLNSPQAEAESVTSETSASTTSI